EHDPEQLLRRGKRGAEHVLGGRLHPYDRDHPARKRNPWCFGADRSASRNRVPSFEAMRDLSVCAQHRGPREVHPQRHPRAGVTDYLSIPRTSAGSSARRQSRISRTSPSKNSERTMPPPTKKSPFPLAPIAGPLTTK